MKTKVKTVNVPCTHCGEIVQRRQKWPVVTCFDCKVKRYGKASRKQYAKLKKLSPRPR